jgi:hypothetical protein
MYSDATKHNKILILIYSETQCDVVPVDIYQLLRGTYYEIIIVAKQSQAEGFSENESINFPPQIVI